MWRGELPVHLYASAFSISIQERSEFYTFGQPSKHQTNLLSDDGSPIQVRRDSQEGEGSTLCRQMTHPGRKMERTQPPRSPHSAPAAPGRNPSQSVKRKLRTGTISHPARPHAEFPPDCASAYKG